jgi:hypothetical protein
VTVEGGNLGKRGGRGSGDSSQLRRWCRKTTPFRCPGKESQGEVRGVPRQGYLCGNNQCDRTLPPSLPIAHAHIACSLGGGSSEILVAKMSTMRPGTGDAATASMPGERGSGRGALMTVARTTTAGMSWTAAGAMQPVARRAPP